MDWLREIAARENDDPKSRAFATRTYESCEVVNGALPISDYDLTRWGGVDFLLPCCSIDVLLDAMYS